MNIFLITKIIAFITMVIDHVGVLLNINLFRIIGRISFPLFCLLFGYGTRNTKSQGKRLIKLIVIAIISQPIHMLYFENSAYNIFFGFALFNLIAFITNKLELKTHEELFMVSTASIMCQLYGVSYGWLLIVLCYIFYKFKNKYLIMTLYTICIFIYMFYKTHYTKLFTIHSYMLVALVFIYLFYLVIEYKKNKGIELKRHVYKSKVMNIIASNIFYVLYPLHLLVLYLIKIGMK